MTLSARIDALAAAVRDKMNSKLATADYVKGLAGWCSGKPVANEVVAGGKSPYAFAIVAANCRATAGVAATASTVFVIKKNGVQIGTITFAAGATLATFAFTGTTVVVDDRLTIVGPATADATLADIDFLIRG